MLQKSSNDDDEMSDDGEFNAFSKLSSIDFSLMCLLKSCEQMPETAMRFSRPLLHELREVLALEPFRGS